MIATYVTLCMMLNAMQAADLPEPIVGVGRVRDFLLDLSPLTPKSVYREGKVSDIAVRQALHWAIAALGEDEPERFWRRYFRPSDAIGLQIDCSWPPVTMPLVDVVIDEIVRAGANPNRIRVFAGDERELYRAGLVIRNDATGIKVLGTASEGFRGGLSRLVLDQCDVIINVARLRADARVGLWGCVANHTVCVDYPQRLAALQQPELLCQIASRPTVRTKTRLHVLDALQPPYQPPQSDELPPRWQYGGIIVSADPVAADLIGQELLEAYRKSIGIQPAELQPQPSYLQEACARGVLSRAIAGAIKVRVLGYQEGALIQESQ
jgi:hypothetical protein